MKQFIVLFFAFATAAVSAQDNRVQTILTAINTDSLGLTVRRLSGEVPVEINGVSTTIDSRFYNAPGNMATYHYARERFEAYGLETQTHSFSANGRNLLAIKTGTIFPERVCMIGAHYDAVPAGAVAPGADDNASGCAAILEAARLLAPLDFPNTVVFVLWDEEELGLIGSTAYVEDGVIGDSLLGYINLDMIGWDGNGDKLVEVHTRPVANSFALLEIAQHCNNWYNLGLTTKIRNPGSINTDHHPFWQHGYSALGINEEYSGDFNPNYHTVNDVYAQLDLAYMTLSTKLALAVLTTLAYDKSPLSPVSDVVARAVLFPNPTDDLLRVQFPEAVMEPFTVEVTDQQGHLVLKASYTQTDQVTVSLRNKAAGNYRLTISGPGFQQVFPVVRY